MDPLVAEREVMLRTETSVMHIEGLDARLLHAILGIGDETGELIKLVKDKLYYNKQISLVSIIEELGDMLWYFTLAADALANNMGIDFEETCKMIVNANREKLKARYPDKYTNSAAINRDVGHEQNILKQVVDERNQDESTS